MEIGRKIYYDKTNGKILIDTGQREGDDAHGKNLAEDLQTYAIFIGSIPANNLGILQLQYDERISEFDRVGSYEVRLSDLALVIYPRLTATLDKPSILSDGVDKATVTVQTANMVADTITFTVSGTPQAIPTDASGKAVFALSSTLPGEYMVSITSNKYGSDAVKVSVV